MEIVYQDGQLMINRNGVIASVADTESAIMAEIKAHREIITGCMTSAKATVTDIVKDFKVTKVVDKEAESQFELARSAASAALKGYNAAASELSRLHLLVSGELS